MKTDESTTTPLKLNQYANMFTWMMQLYLISHIYYGDVSLAQNFADKVLPSFKGDQRAFENLIFLKGLAGTQEGLARDNELSLENVNVMATLAMKASECWKWKVGDCTC